MYINGVNQEDQRKWIIGFSEMSTYQVDRHIERPSVPIFTILIEIDSVQFQVYDLCVEIT